MKKIACIIKRKDWLCLLTIIVTVLQLFYFTLEFFKPGVLKLPTSAPFLYFTILSTWVIKKEINRWLKKKWIKKKGELYVACWLIMTWLMILISTITKGKYELPSKLIETVLYVVMIYLGTCFSKYRKYKQLMRVRKKEERAKANLIKQKVNVS